MLGVRVDDVTMAEAIAWADRFIRQGGRHQIATVNVEFLVAAQRDAHFRQALDAASLCVPDSVGILWGAWLLGYRLRERVAGVDLTRELARLAARQGYRLFLLGAAPGVAEMAAQRLCARYAGLHIAGTYAGSPASAEETEIIARINAARPQILLVAYGAPQQDLWIARNKKRLESPLAMGVGGSFDYIAGVAVRAPLPLQKAGLEWLYRLYRQPWRWRRMCALPYCACLVARQRVVQGRARPFTRRLDREEER